jgi:hypothetical protein
VAERWSHGLDWSTILWILVLTWRVRSPFVFTWKGLLLFFVLSWLTARLGVCLGYHRLFAPPFPNVSDRPHPGLLGTLAGQGRR